MAEKSIPQHRTCEICGEESPASEFALSVPDGRWIHAGPCFLEFGIIQNTLQGTVREVIQRLCQLHRERARAWKTIACAERERLAEENRLLKAAPPALITLDDHDQLVAHAVAAERARIRRDLLEAPELRKQDISIGRVVALIDRICPEGF